MLRWHAHSRVQYKLGSITPRGQAHFNSSDLATSSRSSPTTFSKSRLLSHFMMSGHLALTSRLSSISLTQGLPILPTKRLIPSRGCSLRTW